MVMDDQHTRILSQRLHNKEISLATHHLSAIPAIYCDPYLASKSL